MTVSASGWISERRSRASSPDGYMRLQGAGADRTLPVRVDGSRPDVATALRNPGSEASGFRTVADVRGLAPGRYRLTIYRQVSDGGLVACASPRTLVARITE